MFSEATVKVKIGDRVLHEVAEGNGPVNALNRALRKAIGQFYPRLRLVHLTDYKVRILDSTSGTAAMTRVLIDFADGERIWTTVGASTNIIEASWIALCGFSRILYQHRRRAQSRRVRNAGTHRRRRLEHSSFIVPRPLVPGSVHLRPAISRTPAQRARDIFASPP